MGTHAAIAMTSKRGKHQCIEHTMDGHYVLDELARWINNGLTEKNFPGSGWGTGSEEWNDDREHDQGGLYFHVNFKEKKIYLGPSLVDAKEDARVRRCKAPTDPFDMLCIYCETPPDRTKWYFILKPAGWEMIDGHWDCPEGSRCYERTREQSAVSD